MKNSLVNKVNIVHTWIIAVMAAMVLLTLIGATIAADADARLDHNCIDTCGQ
jgi:hypothetical protein